MGIMEVIILAIGVLIIVYLLIVVFPVLFGKLFFRWSGARIRYILSESMSEIVASVVATLVWTGLILLVGMVFQQEWAFSGALLIFYTFWIAIKSVRDNIIASKPESITNIRDSSLELITDITIPDSATSIEERAFKGHTSLTNITIPDSVTSIGDGAFAGCERLDNIIIPNSVTSIGKTVFNDCKSLTNITIPDSVTSIGFGAFWGCKALTSITIPNSVTSIGDCAFAGCDRLTDITIPDSVTFLGGGAFWDCISLTNITIPDSVTYIGETVFKGCKSLKCEIPKSKSGLKKVTVYKGYRTVGQSVVRLMNSSEIDEMLGKLADFTLAQRIKLYAKNNKIEQQMLNIPVPIISSNEDLEAFVIQAFPETLRPPYAYAGIVRTPLICYFIIAEKE